MSSFYEIVSKVFQIDAGEINDSLKYQEIQYWDSINHLQLVSELENEFDVEFEMDEIIAMETIGKIKELLGKHGVEVQ